jgi:hypothetical protein
MVPRMDVISSAICLFICMKCSIPSHFLRRQIPLSNNGETVTTLRICLQSADQLTEINIQTPSNSAHHVSTKAFFKRGKI